MKADGSDWIRLTDSSDFDFTPQVSPDGQKIAFASDRDGTLQIYMMNVDGSEVTRLTDNVGNDRDPSWSPDSNKIVFASDRNGDPDIFVIGSDGSGEQQLTDNEAMDVSPVWSPDGQLIVFSSSEEEEDPNLYLISPDGSNLRRITFSPNYDGDQASWSPDGQFLVFPSSRIGNYELYLMSLDGSAFGTLTRTERDEYSGQLSPDGRYLLINVYSSDFIGLVIRDLVTEEEFQLTDSGSRASYASWIPNGTVNYDPAFLLSAGKTDENCVYTDDETYGYTADNPIPNGNGPQFGGPFDGLFVFNIVRVAPAESQTSLRQHTFPSNERGDYLDTYLFTSSGGTSVVLYANINDYGIPKIPVGLFCDLALP